MSTWKDFAEFYTRGPFKEFLLEARSAGSFGTTVIRAQQCAGDVSDPAFPNELVLIRADSHHESMRRDLGGGVWEGSLLPGTFDIVPAGSATSILQNGPHAVTIVSFSLSRLQHALGERGDYFKGDMGRLPAAPFTSRALARLFDTLTREALTENPQGALANDGVTLQILAELSGLAELNTGRRQGRPLSPSDVLSIGRLIEERLGDDLTVEDLAGMLDRSSFGFQRDFKAATGQTPYQFVLERRIARVRQLLETTPLPIAEIAYACGFSSQQHLTNVFSAKLGVTPGRYRKVVQS